MENHEQMSPLHIERHKESDLTAIHTTPAVELVENGNLEDEIFGIINEAFTVESVENRTHEEGINSASTSELMTGIDHAYSSNTSPDTTFVENRNHVDGITDSSSTDFVEIRNSSMSTEEDLAESKSNENDIIKEKAANKKTIVYRVDERPPFFQSILLGFQVRIFIFHLFGGLSLFPQSECNPCQEAEVVQGSTSVKYLK